MIEKKTSTFISVDGVEFTNAQNCIEHESRLNVSIQTLFEFVQESDKDDDEYHPSSYDIHKEVIDNFMEYLQSHPTKIK